MIETSGERWYYIKSRRRVALKSIGCSSSSLDTRRASWAINEQRGTGVHLFQIYSRSSHSTLRHVRRALRRMVSDKKMQGLGKDRTLFERYAGSSRPVHED